MPDEDKNFSGILVLDFGSDDISYSVMMYEAFL